MVWVTEACQSRRWLTPYISAAGLKVEEMNNAETRDCIIIGAGKLMSLYTSDIFVLTLYRTLRHRYCQHVLGTASKRQCFGPRVKAMSRWCLVIWHDFWPHVIFFRD